jgi:hypothetical protein
MAKAHKEGGREAGGGGGWVGGGQEGGEERCLLVLTQQQPSLSRVFVGWAETVHHQTCLCRHAAHVHITIV